MAPLSALAMAWTAAEAALSLGRHIAGVWRFDGTWIALSEGPHSMTTSPARGDSWSRRDTG